MSLSSGGGGDLVVKIHCNLGDVYNDPLKCGDGVTLKLCWYCW